jgi:ABC-type oligopeptide transport system substrate-binding subunit/class 3 adenylate cyclase
MVPWEYAERLLATRGQVTAERRMVTILFSDVKGSTAMAEDLDPEDVMEIMDGAFDVLIEPVYRYEGTLARLMGDAVLAFFGAPIAHEDDPERAIRAALDIIEGAKQYAAELEQERGITGFNVRVGIHTGLVVVGEVGSDLRVEYTAMGDAINLAARMESAAQPGTVLISEDTHKLIAPLFETEALGPVQVKGKAQPVPVYRVLAAKEVPGKVRGIAGLESPLVGREAEFAALQEAVERLEAGVGGVVTLVGEAGLGKSRLVAEIRRVGASHDLPLLWVEGRCLSYGSSIAYLLWLDVLRGLLGVTLEDAPQAVREQLRERVQAACPEHFDDVYPYLARLMSLPLADDLASTLDDMSARDLKAHTFQAVQTLIECAAKQQPLVLVCEDLHWADPTSIELLEQVLALTEQATLLLLCVFRPVKEHACWRFRELAAQTHLDRHTDLLLEPLSAAESQALVANLLRIEELPDALRERILSRAEGNPFYVEEVVRSLIDRGAIVRDEATGRWSATREVADIPIPDTLQGVLMARIDRLREDTKRVLQMASVIGRIFLYRVLAAIAEEERRLGEHLLTLQYQEMIRERARIPELEYIFKHDLTREAAYNGLLKKERRVFHRQVAEALERLLPERVEERPGLLAYHWERAGDAEKAVHYLQRAGDEARVMYSPTEAIDYYHRALAFLREQGQHEQAARTLMKLGLTYHTAFRFEESRQAYQDSFALWQRASAEQPSGPQRPAPHALRVPWVDPQTVDPAATNSIYSGYIIDELFSGLVELSADMNVLPDVARRWEVLEGGRRYVFHLRNDARWSDGTPVSAHDFEYAWKRVLDPATESPVASLLYDIKGARCYHQGETSDPAAVGVNAHDDLTLAVELEAPTGYFLQLLTHSAAYPVPRHVVEAKGKAWARVGNTVTNGPFQLDHWRPGEVMLLSRHRQYHGRFSGNLQQVELTLHRDYSATLQQYESNRADVTHLWAGLSAAERERACQRYAGEHWSQPALAVACIAFDVERPPFDDGRVRRAFALAIDKGRLCEVAMPGRSFPATGGMVPPGIPGYTPGIGLPYDPKRARHLLAEAGYADRRSFPTVRGLAFPGAVHIVEALRAQWRDALGLEVVWEYFDPGSGPNERQRSLSGVLFVPWEADYPDPDNFLRVGFPWSFMRWRNQAYQGLLLEAKHLNDQAKRLKVYAQAERILIDEAPIVTLFYGRSEQLVKPWVKNYPGPWKNVIIEPH